MCQECPEYAWKKALMGLFIEVLINDPFRLFMLPLKFIQSTAQLLMIDSSFLNAEESVSYIQIIDFFFFL